MTLQGRFGPHVSTNARRGLHDGHDLLPQRLLLFVGVLQDRHMTVVGQVLLIGSFDVGGESEEGLAWKERRRSSQRQKSKQERRKRRNISLKCATEF